MNNLYGQRDTTEQTPSDAYYKTTAGSMLGSTPVKSYKDAYNDNPYFQTHLSSPLPPSRQLLIELKQLSIDLRRSRDILRDSTAKMEVWGAEQWVDYEIEWRKLNQQVELVDIAYESAISGHFLSTEDWQIWQKRRNIEPVDKRPGSAIGGILTDALKQSLSVPKPTVESVPKPPQ